MKHSKHPKNKLLAKIEKKTKKAIPKLPDTPETKPLSWEALNRFKTASLVPKAGVTLPEYQSPQNPFKPRSYPVGVFPDNETKLAYDASFADGFSGFGNYHGEFQEGIGYFGYQYLAELAQRSEYRQPCEVLAEEMTRKWITLKSTSDDDDSKSDKIEKLNDAMRRFKLRECFRDAVELECVFGLSFIYPDLLTSKGGQAISEDNDELFTKLMVDPAKIGKGCLRGFTVVDPTWSSPIDYNSINPLDPTFYKPQRWFIMAKRIHASRLLTFISRPLPDLLKPGYNFGGLSLLQMMKPYVDNWLSTRQAVNDLLNSFTQFVLSTNMQAVLQGGGSGNDVDLRLQLFSLMRNNRGTLAIDKDTETLENISAPLGTLDKLQAQAQEHMSSPARIPIEKLFGIQPTGLNASSEGQIRMFYDSIHGQQERLFTDKLKVALDIIQLNEFGTIDPDIVFEYNPLWELDEAGSSAVRKTDADTDAVYIGVGVISPEESRSRIANDPSSLYDNLEGPPPEPIMMEGDNTVDTKDNASRITNKGEEGENTGANSGV